MTIAQRIQLAALEAFTLGKLDQFPESDPGVTHIDGVAHRLDEPELTEAEEAEERAVDEAAFETEWIRLGGRERP